MIRNEENQYRVRLAGLVLWLAFGLIQSCLSAPDIQTGRQREKIPSSYKIQKDKHGKYWFTDAKGNQLLSIGINDIVPEPFRPRPETQYYNPVVNQFKGDFDAWRKDVFQLLQENGFNTIGAWSDGRLLNGPIAGTICLYVAGHGQDRCLDGLRPGFEDRVRENTEIILAQYPYLGNVLGVFLDNEMPWYGHAAWGDIPNYTLLETALALPAEDGARQAALNFLKQRYSSIEELSRAWGKSVCSWDEVTFDLARSCMNDRIQDDRNAFIGMAADRFYQTACRTVHEMLPGILILGTRFAGYAPQPVIEACGRYCDVISFNNYRAEPAADPDMLARFWIWGGQKPLMVTEYAWRAEENTSGNPNTGGAGAVVKTQAQRGENYQKYVEDLLSYPMVIGAHWFEFADQSPQGRFDGENSNYGVVDIHNRPYTQLLSAMKQTNQRIHAIHAESGRQAPQFLPKPKPVVFEASQRPERPPFMDLLSVVPAKDPELFQAPDASIRPRKENEHLAIEINTGNNWGCGILFFGPKEWKVSQGPSFATDLDGYNSVEMDADIPESVTFDLLFDEAGVDRPDAQSYDMSAGDDAEGFLFSSVRGTGQRKVYRFYLKNVEPRTAWGNQKGARRVDIHAMKGIALYFNGGQGEQMIQIFSLKFVR